MGVGSGYLWIVLGAVLGKGSLSQAQSAISADQSDAVRLGNARGPVAVLTNALRQRLAQIGHISC